MAGVRAVLKVPPTTNNLYREATSGKPPGPVKRFRVKSGAYKAWQRYAFGQLPLWMKELHKDKPRLGWSLTIRANIDHTRDLDNCIKPTQDTLAEYLGLNDAYCNEVTAWRVDTTLGGEPLEKNACEVRIYIYGEADGEDDQLRPVARAATAE